MWIPIENMNKHNYNWRVHLGVVNSGSGVVYALYGCGQGVALPNVPCLRA